MLFRGEAPTLLLFLLILSICNLRSLLKGHLPPVEVGRQKIELVDILSQKEGGYLNFYGGVNQRRREEVIVKVHCSTFNTRKAFTLQAARTNF